jgi:hypothetical protein
MWGSCVVSRDVPEHLKAGGASRMKMGDQRAYWCPVGQPYSATLVRCFG